MRVSQRQRQPGKEKQLRPPVASPQLETQGARMMPRPQVVAMVDRELLLDAHFQLQAERLGRMDASKTSKAHYGVCSPRFTTTIDEA